MLKRGYTKESVLLPFLFTVGCRQISCIVIQTVRFAVRLRGFALLTGVCTLFPGNSSANLPCRSVHYWCIGGFGVV